LIDCFLIIVGAVVIIIVASIYPARKASSTNPLNVLRNE